MALLADVKDDEELFMAKFMAKLDGTLHHETEVVLNSMKTIINDNFPVRTMFNK